MKCLLVLGCILLFFAFPFTTFAEENQCISCHTSARKLIKITREIATDLRDIVTESPESVGEG